MARPRDGVFSTKPGDWSRTLAVRTLLSVSFYPVSSAVASLYVDLRKSTTHPPDSAVRPRPSSSSRVTTVNQPPSFAAASWTSHREHWRWSGSNNRTRCPRTPTPFLRLSIFAPYPLPRLSSFRSSTSLAASRLSVLFHRFSPRTGKRGRGVRGVTHRLWILMTRAMNSDRAKGGSSAVNPLVLLSSLVFSEPFQSILFHLSVLRFSPPRVHLSSRLPRLRSLRTRSFNNISPFFYPPLVNRGKMLEPECILRRCFVSSSSTITHRYASRIILSRKTIFKMQRV